jgi:lysophospholipase L1-like esterase
MKNYKKFKCQKTVMWRFYVIYILVLLFSTFYISFEILKKNSSFLTGLFIKEKIYPLFEENLEKSKCPCEKIGIEPPGCDWGRMFLSTPNLPVENILRSNTTLTYDGANICLSPTTVTINSQNFRDHEYRLDKSNNTFRIIALGDSYTFGQGVEINDTYPKILEILLNSKHNKFHYEVLNFGVPGYTMEEKVWFFKNRGLNFNPDLIILQYAPDDIFEKEHLIEIKRNLYDKYIQKNNSQKIDTNFQHRITNEAYKIYMNELSQKPFQDVWKYLKNSLEDLAKITKEKNITVIVFTFEKDEYIDSLRNFSQNKNWLFLDLSKKIDKDPSKLVLNSKDYHFNSIGYKLIADEIYKEFFINN